MLSKNLEGTGMSVFGNIMSAIFGHSSSATAATATSPPTAAPPASAASVSAPAEATPAASPTSPIDVAAIMEELATRAPQQLNWRTSIVDLMKLINLDSSLAARKELAQELHYTGDMNDSASMNVWLHKEVMTKLAENGGKVPDDLKH
jgi:hypothetical protein